ncbi:MAG: heme A synthase [Halobacteriovoraceae bacterium]|nr:heme A synthase [Halobacteriovoraceae bacterium]
MKNKDYFHKSLLISIFAVYFLIFVGGLVRSTGSGMGCPDWPKCFGQWVPPMEKSELPSNYKEIFKVQGKEIADFNAFKTWTEYINRLIGVIIGFCVLAVFITSFSYLKECKEVPILSFFTLIVLGFQGWLGAVVVSTNLAQWMITIHMLVAFFIVFLLFYLWHRTKLYKIQEALKLEAKEKQPSWNLAATFVLVTLFITIIQVILGTQTREEVNLVQTTLPLIPRGNWVENLGVFFNIHRTFSILVLGSHIGLFLYLKNKVLKEEAFFNKALLYTVSLEVISGIGMAYFGIPAFLQPIHLLLASFMVGFLFYLSLSIPYQHLAKQKNKTS